MSTVLHLCLSVKGQVHLRGYVILTPVLLRLHGEVRVDLMAVGCGDEAVTVSLRRAVRVLAHHHVHVNPLLNVFDKRTSRSWYP